MVYTLPTSKRFGGIIYDSSIRKTEQSGINTEYMSSNGRRNTKYQQVPETELVIAPGHRSWPKKHGNGSRQVTARVSVFTSWQVKLTESFAETHSAYVLYHLGFHVRTIG